MSGISRILIEGVHGQKILKDVELIRRVALIAEHGKINIDDICLPNFCLSTDVLDQIITTPSTVIYPIPLKCTCFPLKYKCRHYDWRIMAQHFHASFRCWGHSFSYHSWFKEFFVDVDVEGNQVTLSVRFGTECCPCCLWASYEIPKCEPCHNFVLVPQRKQLCCSQCGFLITLCLPCLRYCAREKKFCVLNDFKIIEKNFMKQFLRHNCDECGCDLCDTCGDEYCVRVKCAYDGDRTFKSRCDWPQNDLKSSFPSEPEPDEYYVQWVNNMIDDQKAPSTEAKKSSSCQDCVSPCTTADKPSDGVSPCPVSDNFPPKHNSACTTSQPKTPSLGKISKLRELSELLSS